jgi:hypothetical protein
MNFVDVVATDQFGKQNSTTCTVLAAEFYTPEANPMAGSLGLRLDPNAIDDPTPGGLSSLDDIFFAILSSSQLRTLIDRASSRRTRSATAAAAFAVTHASTTTVSYDTPSTAPR